MIPLIPVFGRVRPCVQPTRSSKLDTVDGCKLDLAAECHNTMLQPAGPPLSLPPLAATPPDGGLQDTAVLNRLVSNDGESGTLVIVAGVPHVVPPRCRFLCSDMRLARTALPQQVRDLHLRGRGV